MPKSEVGESFAALFTPDDSRENRSATLTEGIARDACELKIGILEHFLNPAGNTRMLLRQTGSSPGEIPQIANSPTGV